MGCTLKSSRWEANDNDPKAGHVMMMPACSQKACFAGRFGCRRYWVSEIRRDGNAPLGDSATQSQNSAMAFCLERRSSALDSAPAGLNIDLTHVADGKYSPGGS